MSRVSLSPFFENQKSLFVELFESLRAGVDSNYYVSLWAELRKDKIVKRNLQGSDISATADSGMVFRVYDGETLFEKATNDFSPQNLKQSVVEFCEEVSKKAKSLDAVAYQSPTWKDRLKMDLDTEITTQIPEGVDSQTWVHFSPSCKKSLLSDSELPNYLKTLFDRLVEEDEKSAEKVEPDFVAVGGGLQEDHMVYIDSEVRLTQTLLRNRIGLTLFKGADYASVRVGGVGGHETLEFQESDFSAVYDKLRQSLKAGRLKPGRYKLLMSPSITGTFAHEAFGHSQEGDTWARGRSKCKELFEAQTRVGNDQATILNNPAIYKNGLDDFAAWGSYFFDEEGWFAQEQYLVDKGFLKAPMTNLTSALRLQLPRTANGKRESWKNAIYTRQTNTYFSAGDKSFDDMVQSMDYGFYAEDSAGGMEDPKGMGIQVGIQILHEIKDGEFTGATFKGPNGGDIQLTGYVPEYLENIISKSKINAHGEKGDVGHPWNEVGGCGKYHKELVNAGSGGPYVLIDQALLG